MTIQIMSKGKVIGVFNEETLTYTTYRKPHHFMRKFQGFGISSKVLTQLWAYSCKDIKIVYINAHDQTTIYRCKILQYLDSDLEHTDDGDRQKFVPVKAMDIERGNGNQKTLF